MTCSSLTFPASATRSAALKVSLAAVVGQLFDGERTRIEWGRHRIVLPTMPGPFNEASGAVIHTSGIGGGIVRGLTCVDANGQTIRPDLVLADDPQDRESARSTTQTSERLQIINGDLAGLAGPDQSIAMLATVTIIERGDLADQLLDPASIPHGRGRSIGSWFPGPNGTTSGSDISCSVPRAPAGWRSHCRNLAL